MKTLRKAATTAVLVAFVLALVPGPGAAQPGPKTRTRDEVIDAAIDYLKKAQAEDGTWSKTAHPGITGVVLVGLFRTDKVKADDALVSKGLKFIEGMVDAKEGHLANAEKLRHKNYVTAVNLMALKASGAKYDAVIANAAAFLKKSQIDEGEEKKAEDPTYRGFGYGPATAAMAARPDLSNTQYALDALKAAGVPKDDPVYQKAIAFVSRVQHLKGEANNLPWAEKYNDGSFVYVLPGEVVGPGYGSMTYAGIKSLIQCGVPREDVRVKKALEWVAKNYSVDVNPGRADGAGGQGYYYYLVTMAKCFDALGVDEFTDASGKVHDWRADITRALANRQKKDGSWGNDFPNWMESNPDLDTAYALIALSYCKPRTK